MFRVFEAKTRQAKLVMIVSANFLSPPKLEAYTSIRLDVTYRQVSFPTPIGTTFNSFGAYDEEEHLKRELADLDRQVKNADSRSSTSSFSSSAGSTLQQQLQQLYDYKLRQLTERQNLEARLEQQERDLARARQLNRETEARAAEARAQRRELERVLDDRRAEIVRVGREIEAEGRA